MKYISIALAIFCALALNTAVFAQTNKFLGACQFLDVNNAIATGVTGTEVRSADGGVTWTNQSTGLTENLNDVSFYDANNGIMIGAGTISGSNIYRTTNGGLTWTYKSSSVTTLQSIAFKSSSFAVIVGNSGTVLKSTDGGTTWLSQTSGTTNNLYGLSFVDANVGTAVGQYGIILRTTNGGVSWTSQSSGVTSYLRAVHFVDTNVGTAVGDAGGILRTVNGGSSWSKQTASAASGLILYAVKFTDANNGTIGGQGVLLHTTNAGATWTGQSAPATIAEISFSGANQGIAVGELGTILRTANGGVTWVQVAPAAGSPLSVSVNSPSVCNGSSATLTATPSGGTSPYTYSWNTGATTQSITVSTAGTYTVTVTDANAATASGSGTLTVNTPPTVSVSSVAVCATTAGTLTATPSGGTSPYTYSWSGPGGFTATTQSISATTAGTYTATVTDSKGCSGSGSGVLTVNPLPSVTVNSLTVCAGTSGTLTAAATGGTSPYSYSWNTGATTSSITTSTGGTYTVTVTDSKGCTASGSGVLTVNAALAMSLSSTNISCNGGTNGTITATLSGGTAPYTMAIDGGSYAAATSPKSFTGLSAGSHTVYFKDALGCIISQSVTLSQPSVLAFSVSNTNLSCNGGSNGSITLTATGGTSPYTYSKDGIIFQASNAFTGLPAGSYSCTVKDANGCLTSQSVTITQPAAITVTLGKTDVSCFGGTNGSISVTAGGGTSPYTYSKDGTTFQASSTFSGLAAGTYTITVKDASSCTKTASITITQPLQLSCSVAPVAVCAGSTGTLTASVTGGTSPYTYSWNTGATTSSITTSTAGTYTVSITDSKGCTTSASGTLTVNSLPILTCTGDSLTSTKLTATTTVSSNPSTGVSYSWSGAGLVSGGTTASATWNQSGSKTVVVTNTSTGCQSSCVSQVTQVVVSPPLSPVLSAPVSGSTNQITTLTLSWNVSSGATSYRLQVGTDSTFASGKVVDDSTITTTSRSVGTLLNNTKYFWRVNAKNSAGTSTYSSTWNFTTVPLPPTVTTTAATSVTSSSGSTNGTVNPNGVATTAWFEWGTNSTLSTYNSTTSQSAGSGTSAVAVSANLTGLSPNTTYYFRIAAQNSAGTQRDGILNFTTAAVLPTVTTTAATSITTSTVTLNGTENPNGAATSAWFEWGTSSTLTSSTSTASQAIGSGTGAVAVSANLTTLSPNTTYYYRAVGQNAAGTQKDGILSFTTSPLPPVVTTTAATSVTSSSGTANGTVNPNGVATTAWFEWGTSNTLTTYTSTTSQSAGSGTSAVAVSASLTGLNPNTIYYYRVAAQNSAGTQRDGILSFTTAAVLPTVTTTAATSITTSTVTLNGTENPNGAATSAWFEWGTSSTLTSSTSTASQAIGSGTSTVAVSANLTGLSAGTTYYYRAVGQNSAGTQKDGILSFSTSSQPLSPPATPVLLSPVSGSTNQSTTLTLSWNASSGATTYRLQVSTSSVFSTLFLDDSTLAATTRQVTGLGNNTTYYWRVSAKNGSGSSAFSAAWNFVTIPLPPVVTTTAATSMTSSSGTANGTVNPNGVATTAWFEWGTNSTLSTYNSTTSQSAGSGASAIAVSANLTGLSPNTTYYFRIAAQNSAGTQRDGILNFTTAAVLPTVTTTAATSITTSTVTLNGTENPNGAATSAWFEWGTSSTLTSSTSTASQAIGSGTGAVAVSANLTTLSPNTTYYYRAVGQNAAGTQKDGILSFTTSPLPPPSTPTLLSPTDAITSQPTTVTLSWNASSGATSYRLQVSTSSVFSTLFLDDSTLTTTTRQVTGLANNTTYYWRVNAKNSGAASVYSSAWSLTTVVGTPLFSANPINLSFGNTLLNVPKKDSITISNPGGSTLTITTIKSSSQKFKISATNASVLPGSSVKIYVTFTVTQKKIYTGRIIFTHNAPGSPDTVLVSGQGVTALAAATTINFGSVSVGSSKKDSFPIYNDGDVQLPVISVISTNSTFSVTPTSAFIAPYDSQWFYIDAHPLTTAEESGYVIVNYDIGLPADTFIVKTNSVTGVDIEKNPMPHEFALSQNYPNPFNPVTTIRFSVPTESNVTLRVFNPIGQEIASLIKNQVVSAGDGSVEFDGATLSSGVYFYRIEATSTTDRSKTFIQLHKMILTK